MHTSAAYTLPTIPVVVYVPDINDSSSELVIDPDFEDSTHRYYHRTLCFCAATLVQYLT